MLAIGLLILLCLELGLYVTLVTWLNPSASGLFVLFVCIGLALGLRIAGIAVTSCLSAAVGGTSPALSLWSRIRLFASELFAFIVLFVVLQPLEPILMRRRTTAVSSPPVVLLHGIYCNSAIWWWLRRKLAARGMDELSWLNFAPPFASIDTFVNQLANHIERVCHATGASQVILVSHSMGGLVARGYLRVAGGARVAKLISIAAPHHGSALAKWGWGRNAQQLRSGSAWLAELINSEQETSATPIVSIYSEHDNLVAPQTSARLDHAINLPVREIGHLAMLFSTKVLDLIDNEVVASRRVISVAHR